MFLAMLFLLKTSKISQKALPTCQGKVTLRPSTKSCIVA